MTDAKGNAAEKAKPAAKKPAVKGVFVEKGKSIVCKGKILTTESGDVSGHLSSEQIAKFVKTEHLIDRR